MGTNRAMGTIVAEKITGYALSVMDKKATSLAREVLAITGAAFEAQLTKLNRGQETMEQCRASGSKFPKSHCPP